jgi:hypothetical protein
VLSALLQAEAEEADSTVAEECVGDAIGVEEVEDSYLQ